MSKKYQFECCLLVAALIFASSSKIHKNVRKLADNAPILKVTCEGYVTDKEVKFSFSPPLVEGVHFYKRTIDKHIMSDKLLENSSPNQMTFSFHLIKGQSNQHVSTAIPVATIVKGRRLCPEISSLPGASKALKKYLHKILDECNGVNIFNSKSLQRRKVDSLSLLYLEPPLLLIDGSDQSLSMAAHSVDKHGMPGHLFLILDTIQWRHNYVSSYSTQYNRNNYNTDNTNPNSMKKCLEDQDQSKQNHLLASSSSSSNTIINKQLCIPGCANTIIKTVTASGYNADTKHLVDKFAQALSLTSPSPFQAAPVRLGVRATPPIWDHTLGWSYTFGACSSNFLDCFFLDHSPCPKIDIDVNDPPGGVWMNASRLLEQDESSSSSLSLSSLEMNDSPRWLETAVGYKESLSSGLTSHILYSYLFRPKYVIRKEIQRRVDSFRLRMNNNNKKVENERYVMMHVRRGDI
eukprot:gene6147-12454_t